MRFLIPCSFLFLLLTACQEQPVSSPSNNNPFGQEMDLLQEYFQIPGLAVLVQQNGEVVFEQYKGWSDMESKDSVNAATVFPVASLTKNFAAVVALQLMEEGQLDLEDPVNKYAPDMGIPDSIEVQHILSHTSQGPVGKQFYYSFRFGLLTQIIESVTSEPFEAVLQKRILDPLILDNSFLLKDSAQLASKQVDFAQPYFHPGEERPGFIDYGFSSSAGMVSNARELAKFYDALENGALLSPESKEKMHRPFYEGSPYGLGIFHREFAGLEFNWAYGQYDCYASLYISVPSKQLQLIVMANNNLMSDPARLIYGDPTSSLFVLSFLKNWVLDQTSLPIMISKDALKFEQEDASPLRRELLLAQALAASFMARYDSTQMQESTQLLDYVFATYPNFTNYADLSTMHNLMFLKDVAFYMELGAFDQFDRQTEQIGNSLLAKDPLNPYINVYLGNFYDQQGKEELARKHFETILNTPNFSSFWYTNVARNWLNNH